ncbi:recombination directionality factor [Azospirillum aestuarii]|uniref:recombination directionality factor n=1 Tax=Azospirillum aestuarii TaxID=2802052 RepID=UPI0040551CD9
MTSTDLVIPERRQLADFRPQGRSLRIKTMPLQLPEIGKIKIGMKGAARTSRGGTEFQPPQKLDHFLVTTLERGQDNNYLRDERVHAQLGEKPRDLPVRLVFDDPELNFQSRLVAYQGKTLWCHGDGITSQRLQKDGTWKDHDCSKCPLADPAFQAIAENQRYPKCKMNGRLAVMLDTASTVGGVHVLRTTSYNTIVGITSSLAFLTSVTGGPLAGIPLTMSIRPKTATDPTGKTQTIYVVSLGFAGAMEQLQSTALDISLRRERNRARIEQVEQEARLMLAAPIGGGDVLGDDAADVVDEFYHEEVQRAADAAPPKPTRGKTAAQPSQAATPTVIEVEPEPIAPEPEPTTPEPEPSADYELVAIDGEVRTWMRGQEQNYVTSFLAELANAARAGKAALEGLWESNTAGLAAAPEGLIAEVQTEYRRLLAEVSRPAPQQAAQPKAAETASQQVAASTAAAKPPKASTTAAPPPPPPAGGDDDLF